MIIPVLGLVLLFVLGAFLRKIVGDELRARLDDLPAVLVTLAARRLPEEVRDDYRVDWESNCLAALNDQTVRYPVTRFVLAMRLAFNLFVQVRMIRAEYSCAAVTNHPVRTKIVVTTGIFACIAVAGAVMGVVLTHQTNDSLKTPTVLANAVQCTVGPRAAYVMTPDKHPSTPRTSCEFANDVRSALLQAASTSQAAEIDVLSPIFSQVTRMRCEQPSSDGLSRCRGGAGALVLVART